MSSNKIYSESFIVLYAKRCLNSSDNVRVGITVSKKIGISVKRNKCKRIIRSLIGEVIYYSNISKLDMNIIARSDFLKKDYPCLVKEMKNCIEKIEKENNV